MFRNYLIIAWRSLNNQRLNSFINIGGLAIGVAACLLIGLYIKNELSYEKHLPDKNRIFRLVVEFKEDGQVHKNVYFQAPLAQVLKEEFPEIEKSGRCLNSGLHGSGANQVRRGDRLDSYYEEGFVFYDPELLEILNLKMVLGDYKQALNEPNTIVISKRKADKYFPNENPLGKILLLNNDTKNSYKIGGVLEDLTTQSHLPVDFLITLKGKEFFPGEQTSWCCNNYYNYVLVRPGTDIAQLEEKLLVILDKYIVRYYKEQGRVVPTDLIKSAKFILQPIGDIHLKSYDITDSLIHGDIRLVWTFGGIALFILVIAGINYINLSTAKSANRAKEVGIRKVVGSSKGNLVNQFLVESILLSLLAFSIGLFLAWALLPHFNKLSGKVLEFPLDEWWFIPSFIVSAIGVGTMAGVYPSFYLSAFKPIQVLKGDISRGSKNSKLRGFLVIFQFTISIILIVGTLTIYLQMDYILNKKVGYEKDQVLLVHSTNTLADKVKTFKNELLQLTDVKSVSVSDFLPIKGTLRNGNSFWKEGKIKEETFISGQIWEVDHDYIKTMGMKIVEGRDFSAQLATDSHSVIVNQSMVKKFGFKNPIGKRITNRNETWPIIGVVEDFHFESLKDSIRPICLAIGKSPSIVSVKLQSSDMEKTIQTVSKLWKDFAPHQPIRFSFLDENYAAMYEDVKRTGNIFSAFALLAIVVACLGLFALSSFMLEQRRKEISVRLVLGASAASVFKLISFNFLKLVFLSWIIAIPISKFIMQKWLNEFVYRTEMGWEIFLLAGLLALFIAVATISYQVLKTAKENPVEGLRSE